ncbi:hypothetical protein TWF281_006256 [Arthrobotrys megalospora]
MEDGGHTPGILPEDELNHLIEQRTPVLKGGEARFIPQWDEQILGTEDARNIVRDYADPPKPTPPDELQFHPCTACGLVWLGGYANERITEMHPSHQNLAVHTEDTSRSIMVYTKGIWKSDEKNGARASVGIYFGPQSRHNISLIIKKENLTAQSAEVTAMAEAIRYVRTVIIPERKDLIYQALEEERNRLPTFTFLPSSNPHFAYESLVFRLILVTDYSYIVECLCRTSPRTSIKDEFREEFEGENTSKDSEGFLELLNERRRLAMAGAYVVWYHVSPEFNSESKRLAESVLESTGMGGKKLDLSTVSEEQ